MSALPDGVTARWDGSTLVVAIAGRATGPVVAALRAELEAALDRGERFAVLFDRRLLTAPTADGRAELERWGAELTPRLGSGCLGWADLFDERRAASLARARPDAPDGPDAPDDPGPYPQRTFADLDDAVRWLADVTGSRSGGGQATARPVAEPAADAAG